MMERGTSVVIVRRPPSGDKQQQSTLVDQREAVLGLETATDGWVAGEELLLLTTDERGRRVADARYLSTRDGVGIVKVLGEWRPFDSRGRGRFSTSVEVVVRAPGTPGAQPGTVSDVSKGGMAVRVRSLPLEDSVEIVSDDIRFSKRRFCRVVGSHKDGDNTVLHLAFPEAQ